MCVTKFKCIKLFGGVTVLNLRKSEQFTNSVHSVGQMKEDAMFKTGGMCISVLIQAIRSLENSEMAI